MRIALLTDVHGNLAALEAVIEDLGHRGVDTVVNLGDGLSGPLLPRETAQTLMAQDWLHLAGNHERQLLTLGPDERGPSDAYAYSRLTPVELEWIATLRPSAPFGEDVLLCHGTPGSDCEYLLETPIPGGLRLATPEEIEERLGGAEARVVACGHSHVPRAVRTRSGQLVLNPGSVGLPAYDAEHPLPHVVETGSPDARYAILEKRGDRWIPELIAVPYDHEAMARLARLRGRDDWERALRTGYVSR
jgi:predicted phosphodiesterase